MKRGLNLTGRLPWQAPCPAAACRCRGWGTAGTGAFPRGIKLDGKSYFTSGVPIDAHGLGLCKATGKAKVAGKVEGDKFVVTGFTLLPKAN